MTRMSSWATLKEEDKNYKIGKKIKLLLDYAFNYLNMHSVWLHLIDCNDRAHACYTKCGFKDCGRRPEAIYLNGKYHDQLTMCILDREFNGEQYIKNRLIK